MHFLCKFVLLTFCDAVCVMKFSEPFFFAEDFVLYIAYSVCGKSFVLA